MHFPVFFFLSSSLSGAAGSLWFITTFLIWAYRGYSIYIIQTPCERSIFTFPSLWIKQLCPFLLDCIPIGQELHHLLSIAWLYLHLLIERTWVTETPRFSPPTPLFALIKKKEKEKEIKLHVSTSLFITHSFPMSSTVDFHSSFSTLGVPTIDLTEDQPLKALESQTSGSSRTVPIRNGLPTPPHDMTGLTYNAMPPIAYGGKPNGMPSHLYSHSRPQFDSISSSMMAMKPQTNPIKEACATEPTAQKKSNGATVSQLRIPSSINNSKGSLAEFAAQVRIPSTRRDVMARANVLCFVK